MPQPAGLPGTGSFGAPWKDAFGERRLGQAVPAGHDVEASVRRTPFVDPCSVKRPSGRWMQTVAIDELGMELHRRNPSVVVQRSKMVLEIRIARQSARKSIGSHKSTSSN
ncbi:hypothetical protein [Methylobacterium oxalidis]|uniref:hypothetical protein n=1 Tax=Methylobacterium oxalidis TaxID=944322 RepID=UPI0011BE305D|nr:hypothetical protein [Methylobacterium oxalidis]